ncbi:hypothetical protein [Synechococcus sp. PCC 7336]|uniref:hypothetical protein n=1 Tax=Synechococcus sp. PCC 7336 TaxID=195250 RepID=UPI00034ADEFF|nr:hypothetical protein [Synechococcus sp. PCC 7336]
MAKTLQLLVDLAIATAVATALGLSALAPAEPSVQRPNDESADSAELARAVPARSIFASEDWLVLR